ncbi:MAG: CBS domain-containing protein [Tepidisphaerales bacterium]
MPCVSEILANKDGYVFTIPPSAEVLEAVRKMNQRRIGALVVVDGETYPGRVVGMFTERDVLRLVGALQDVTSLRVGEVMTRDVVTVSPDADIEEVQEIMKTRRIRHLPVVDRDGVLVGLVSIGDLNAWAVEHQARQLAGMHDYIFGRV